MSVGRQLSRADKAIPPDAVVLMRGGREQGLTFTEIREAFDDAYSIGAIAVACEGIPNPKHVVRANVVAAVTAGMTYREAHVEFDVSVRTIQIWCAHLQLKRSRSWRRIRPVAGVAA